MKRTLGIILAIMMLMTTCVSVSAAELRDDAPPTGVDFMQNGSFEEVTETDGVTAIDGVAAWNGWEHGVVSSTKEEAHTGERSMKISQVAGEYQHPWARIEFTDANIIGGATVEISFWYKGIDIPADAKVGFKFEEYTGYQIRADYGVGNTEYYNWDAQSEWTKVTYQHQLKPDACLVVLYLRLFNVLEGGTAYFDDVELKMVELPEVSFEFKTDQVFYYDDIDQKEGVATVEMNRYFNSEGYTANFALYDGETVLAEAKDVKLINNIAEFKYDLSLLSVNRKEYVIKADVKDPAGKTIKEWTEYAYKYERPKAISKNGTFTDKNGKTIHPVFAYHIGWDDYPSAASVGVNVVQYVCPTDPVKCLEELDKMYEMGVYAAVVCYWGMMPAGHPRNIEQVRAYNEQIKDHPAIFCWMIMDEPFINDFYAHENLRQSYIMLRDIDDHIPTYICEGSALRMYDAIKYTDIIGPDPYPGSWNSYGTFVPYYITMTSQEADRMTKPAIAILQCVSLGDLAHPKPYPIELHSMIIQSYLSGAKGHGWYAWDPDNPEKDKQIQDGEFWDTFNNFYQLESEMLYKYYVSEEHENFNVYKPGDAIEQTGDIWYETWTDGEVVYGVVQNRLNEDNDVDVSLTSANGKVAITDYEVSVIYDGEGDPVLTKGEGSFNVALQPHQAISFKVVPENDVDFSKLSGLGDMDGYDWARDAVNFLYDKGIEEKGESLVFRPGEPITRGEFAKYLIRTLDLKVSKTVANFADVDASADYAKEVAIGRTLSILMGDGKNYNPDSPITRQELMAICIRGMKYKKPIAAQSTDLGKYPDGDKVAAWAVADVATMLEIGIIKGNETGEINPLGNTTRAEAAVIMQRIFNWINA